MRQFAKRWACPAMVIRRLGRSRSSKVRRDGRSGGGVDGGKGYDQPLRWDGGDPLEGLHPGAS